jgi:phosphoribosylanthranilate isomerase
MRVKICGITNLQDALDAIEAGVDALGFVFYKKSARYITPNDACKIIEQLPPFVQCVGLFVNEPQYFVDEVCKKSKVDIAQIITQEPSNYFNSLSSKYIEVIRAKSKEDISNLDPNKFYLVDAFVEEFGGSGKRVALEWFKDIDCSNLILAGGLKSDMLEELKGFNFYSLDISSGVEISKGKKDKQKMVEFISEVNKILG